MVCSLLVNPYHYRQEMKPVRSGDIIGTIHDSFCPNIPVFGIPTMNQDDPNAERYIAIARACLKAINDTAADSGTREQKIQAVYHAIDHAFQAEFADYRRSVAVMGTVLERIASGQLDAEAAASLAKKTLDQQPESTRNELIH